MKLNLSKPDPNPYTNLNPIVSLSLTLRACSGSSFGVVEALTSSTGSANTKSAAAASVAGADDGALAD